MEHAILSWSIAVVILAVSGAYLFQLRMRPKDLLGEIAKITTQNSRLFNEVQAVAGAIADLHTPHNSSSGLTGGDQLTAKRLQFSYIINEGAANIVTASERGRQTIFTMYPPLPDLREDLRRALLRDLELVAIWECVLLKKLYRHAQAIREQLLEPGNSEDQGVRLLAKGEHTLRLLGVIWSQESHKAVPGQLIGGLSATE